MLRYLSRVLLPIVRAAQIVRENVNNVDNIVRALSMRSMAGITVATLGVLQEKNKVASLKIWMKFYEQAKKKERNVTYLQNILKLCSSIPFHGCQFIFIKIKSLDCCHCINGSTVSNGKVKHVKGGVPLSRYILQHHMWS